MPYKRLLPRLQVLSTPPQRYRYHPMDADRDLLRVGGATAVGRTEQIPRHILFSSRLSLSERLNKIVFQN